MPIATPKPSYEVTTIEGEVITLSEAQERAHEQGFAVQLANGQEVGSPVPIAPPIGFTPGPDLIDQIRMMVRREMSLADDLVVDSPEDDEDFDHPDLDEPFTRHEVEGMSRSELQEAIDQYRSRFARNATPEAPGASEPPSNPTPPEAKEGGEAGGSPKNPPANPPAPPVKP